MEVDQSTPINRWRPRFSLWSALLLMTIAGMATVLVQLWREIGPLRVEVRKLRDEVGALTIDDESKLHAIQVRTSAERTWKWRVWVPEGANVTVRYQWGDVPQSGVPQGQGGGSLTEGENVVTLEALRGRDGKTWMAKLATPNGGVGTSIDPDQHWFDWQEMVSTGEEVGTVTEVLDDKSNTHILMRYRVGQYSDSGQMAKVTEPTAGFIIWLEQR